jgi:GH15 family glucan-1,4-alpha-glucosidase
MVLPANKAAWALECALVEHLETIWERPDEGIWEVRGGRRQFTHSPSTAPSAPSKSLVFDGPAERWRVQRDRVHEQVCREGFDP